MGPTAPRCASSDDEEKLKNSIEDRRNKPLGKNGYIPEVLVSQSPPDPPIPKKWQGRILHGDLPPVDLKSIKVTVPPENIAAEHEHEEYIWSQEPFPKVRSWLPLTRHEYV